MSATTTVHYDLEGIISMFEGPTGLHSYTTGGIHNSVCLACTLLPDVRALRDLQPPPSTDKPENPR